MSSNTTIVKDLQRAVTAFNNIETAINSSGLPNTPVEDYPQAIEDLKHGSGGNVQDTKYEYLNLSSTSGTVEIKPDSGYDSMQKVNLNYNVQTDPGLDIERAYKQIKLTSSDYKITDLAHYVTFANELSKSGTNEVKVCDKSGTLTDFESLFCGFNSANADIKVMSKYTYEEYDSEKGENVEKTADTPVGLARAFRNCTCKNLLLGELNNPLTVKSTYRLIGGVNCTSLINTSNPAPMGIALASLKGSGSVYDATIDVLGDADTVVDSTNIGLLDSPGMHLNYRGVYDPATDSYTAGGGILLKTFGVLQSHGGSITLGSSVLTNITSSEPDTGYGSATPGTILKGNGGHYTFGSNSAENDIVFEFWNMTAAEFEASTVFNTTFIDKNTSGHKRELKFSSAASSASGFSTFKTAMESKGYTITVIS